MTARVRMRHESGGDVVEVFEDDVPYLESIGWQREDDPPAADDEE